MTGGRVQKKAPEFLCHVKFKNTLPEPVIDSRLVQMAPKLAKFAPYRASSIEQQHQYSVPMDVLHTSLLDFVDMEKFKPAMNEFLPAADEPLLARADGVAAKEQQHQQQHSSVAGEAGRASNRNNGPSAKEPAAKGVRSEVTWLRRTEYLSSESSRTRNTADRPTAAQPAPSLQLSSREDVLAAIERSFDYQPDPADLRHPTNPNLRAVRILPILPSHTATIESFAQCTFDADPWVSLIDGVQIARDGDQHALMKAMSHADDPNDTFVWYYLPTDVSTSEHQNEKEQEELFLYTRDYDIQRVDRQSHSYFVLSIPESSPSTTSTTSTTSATTSASAALYTPISGHFNLKKRRTKTDSFRERHFLKVDRL